jgi:hypothetical protein
MSESVTFFPILKNEQKKAMGKNELLKVMKIKCWMIGPRSDQDPYIFSSMCWWIMVSIPAFQSLVFSTALSSDLGWVVGRSKWTSILWSSFSSVFLSNFLQLLFPQAAVWCQEPEILVLVLPQKAGWSQTKILLTPSWTQLPPLLLSNLSHW